MKRKNRMSRMQQKRMDTLERLADRYKFDTSLALGDWNYVHSIGLPLFVTDLIRAIQNTKV